VNLRRIDNPPFRMLNIIKDNINKGISFNIKVERSNLDRLINELDNYYKKEQIQVDPSHLFPKDRFIYLLVSKGLVDWCRSPCVNCIKMDILTAII